MITFFQRLLSMRKRVGFHTIWTKPKDGQFWMEDFELITLIASALSWKRHNGPLWLYTDGPGADWVHAKKLGWLYDAIHVALDDIPKSINAHTFWAAGKLFAYKLCPAPCVSIDYDAIIWRHLPWRMECDAVALHSEPCSWFGYRHMRRKHLLDPSWDWNTEALNAGVLAFNSDELRMAYAEAAIDFVTRYSESASDGACSTNYIDEMIFAEQQMLALIAKKMGRRIGYFANLSLQRDHMTPNGLITHLWNSKEGYKHHPVARNRYISDILKHLYEHYPESLPTLRQLNLFHCVITDTNTYASRCSPPGDWGLPGDETTYI